MGVDKTMIVGHNYFIQPLLCRDSLVLVTPRLRHSHGSPKGIGGVSLSSAAAKRKSSHGGMSMGCIKDMPSRRNNRATGLPRAAISQPSSANSGNPSSILGGGNRLSHKAGSFPPCRHQSSLSDSGRVANRCRGTQRRRGGEKASFPKGMAGKPADKRGLITGSSGLVGCVLERLAV